MGNLRTKLERRLSDLLDLSSSEIARVAEEVLDIFGQTADDFIAMRHAELMMCFTGRPKPVFPRHGPEPLPQRSGQR